MKIVNLTQYFDEMGYDWEKDKEELYHILEYTKTRPKKDPPELYIPSAGTEQTFLIKCIAENMKAKTFFEIGTGRGTSCYAVSLLESVEEIVTVDIVSHYTKKNEAINSRPVVVSNADLYDMIKFDQKSKIKFKHVSEMPYIIGEYEEEVDVAFIDGNHSDYDIVYQDYLNCKKIVRPGGIIIFDDYHDERFVVKKVVDDIIQKDQVKDATLVRLVGHLFETNNRRDNCGIVVMRVGE